MSVHPDELTGNEQAVLLALMAESGTVPNARLKDLGPVLTKPQRERLVAKSLIDVRGKPMTITLTDPGWRMCRAIIGTDAPTGVTGQKKVLYTVLKALDRYLVDADLPLAELIRPAEDTRAEPAGSTEAAGPTETPAGSAVGRIIHVYARLVERPGDWVGLTRVRAALPDVPRADLDRALQELYRDPRVSLVPEENQKTLTDDDRAAAVRIGNKENHVIAIRP